MKDRNPIARHAWKFNKAKVVPDKRERNVRQRLSPRDVEDDDDSDR